MEIVQAYLALLPSIKATAEFVVPRSMPITAPLTFFSPASSAYRLMNDEPSGALIAGEVRKADEALGRNWLGVSREDVGVEHHVVVSYGSR